MKWIILVLYLLKFRLFVINCSSQFNSENQLNDFNKETSTFQLKNATRLLIEPVDAKNSEKAYGISKIDNTNLPNGKKWIWIPNFVWSIIRTTTTTPAPAEEPATCPQCTCGVSNPPIRIVNGNEVRALQYPWVSYITYRGRYSCTASIISDKFLLTAAHCTDRMDKNLMTVVVGDHDRSSDTDATPIVYKVEEIIQHSAYSIQNFNNDIALVKIDGRILFNDSIRPVCLPEKGPTFAGDNGTVIGWGSTEEGGPSSNVLREVVVPIMTNGECRGMKYPPRKITENMMCAGYREGGKDSCQGDSGGPLLLIQDKIYNVVGIVSFGEGCASPGYPGVYTRVNRFLTWIQQNTADSCYC